MKKVKKQLSLKKLTTITLIAILLFSLIGAFRVYATGDTFTITNVEISEKSETINVKELSFEKAEINSNIIYHKVGDYIKYKITVKNNDRQSYKVASISDNNENEFITYDYSDFQGRELKANESVDLYVTVKYLKEIEDVTKRTQEMNVELNVTLEDETGNVVTEGIKFNGNNPKTGDPITLYMSTAVISAVVLIILITKGKKSKKSYKGKRFYGILLALVLLTPVTVKAAGNVLTLNFKSVFELNDKVVVTYTNALTGEEEQKIIKYNEKLPIPEDPEKEGYEFIGWFDENGDKVTEETTITEDNLLEAKFKPIEYTIEYDLDYGMVENENPVKYTIENEDITLNNPSRTGYTFEGWTGTDLEQKTKEVKIEKGSIGNREYTANWKVIDYTITYKGLTEEEKTGLNNPTSFNIETPSTTLNNPQDRKDADGDVTERFVGWKENNTTSTNITIPAELENKEYEASWVAVSPNTYTITYNLDGGTVEIANPVSFTKFNTFTLNNPSKIGYTFTGWTGSNGDIPQTTVTVPTGIRENLSYIANWSKNTYTISYDLAGGTVATSNPSEYTVTSDNITLTNPTKTGYTFEGWTGTDLTNKTMSVTISNGSTENREYTANWKAIDYTITYDLKGGSIENANKNPDKYTIESNDITLNNPSRTGYTFAGWTDSNGDTPQTEVTIAKGSTGNKSYTANWTPVSYTISYSLNGGIVASANSDTYTIESNTITLNNPTREGYSFKGWSGTNLTGDTNQEVTIAKGSTENREYTANWTPITYTISYTLNDGTVSTVNPTSYTIESDDIKLNNPSKEGCTFTGWTGSNGETPQTEVTIAKGSTGDKEYTANWTGNLRIEVTEEVNNDTTSKVLIISSPDAPRLTKEEMAPLFVEALAAMGETVTVEEIMQVPEEQLIELAPSFGISTTTLEVTSVTTNYDGGTLTIDELGTDNLLYMVRINGDYIINAKDTKTGRTGSLKYTVSGIQEETFTILSETANANYPSETNSSTRDALIPKGFAVMNGSTKNGGIVITDTTITKNGNRYSIGNEYVWIPVEKAYMTTSEDLSALMAEGIYPMAVEVSPGEYKSVLYAFRRPENGSGINVEPYVESSIYFREPATVSCDDQTEADGITMKYNKIGLTQDTLQEEYNNMIDSIHANGGFYVARYELSYKNGGKSQRGKKVASSLDDNTKMWYGLYSTCKNMYNREEYSVQSMMITGSQYDQIMFWMIKNGQSSYILNCTGKGFFKVGAESPTCTGRQIEYQVMNIYDLAGNAFEWTSAARDLEKRVVRGGVHHWSIMEYTVTSEQGYSPDVKSENFSTRSTLYIK